MAQVKHIMKRKGAVEVTTVAPGITVLEAAHKMNANHIGSLVVVEERGVAGIFTERDVLRRVVAPELDPATVSVGEAMTRPVVICTRDMTVEECREVMTEKRIRHLPVVESGRILGIVTIGDLLAWQVFESQHTIEHLNDYLQRDVAPSGA